VLGKSPTVSVAIRAYRAQFLSETIESVLRQTFADLELIVYDDAGTLEPFVSAHDDQRVRYQRAERKLEGSARAQAALSLCRGEVIGLLDDDDRYEPYFIERLVNEFERNPRLGIAFSSHYWDLGGARFPRQCALRPGTYDDFLVELIRLWPIALSATLMRRAVFEQGEDARPMPPGVWGDLFQWLRAAEERWPFAYIDEPLMTYRVHPDQISGDTQLMAESGVKTWRAFSFSDPEAERLRRRRLAEALVIRAPHRLAEGRRGAALADLREARALQPDRLGLRASMLRLLAWVPLIGAPAVRLWRVRPRRLRLGPTVVE
jgi:glycosyltransferase involved in cell wall biosynthesis